MALSSSEKAAQAIRKINNKQAYPGFPQETEAQWPQ